MRAAALLLAASAILAGCGTDEGASDPTLNPNAGCCVCHMLFIKESLSKTHLEAKITCVRCHGACIGHANDEHIGATPPDVRFKPGEVNPFCRTCHEKHDVPPEKVVARREVEAARPAAAGTIAEARCTDCHGKHRIERPAASETAPAAAPAEPKGPKP